MVSQEQDYLDCQVLLAHLDLPGVLVHKELLEALESPVSKDFLDRREVLVSLGLLDQLEQQG